MWLTIKNIRIVLKTDFVKQIKNCDRVKCNANNNLMYDDTFLPKF